MMLVIHSLRVVSRIFSLSHILERENTGEMNQKPAFSILYENEKKNKKQYEGLFK